MKNFFRNRYATLTAVFLIYILLAFVVRFILTIFSISQLSYSDLPLIFFKGFLFDIAVALAFVLFYSIYLLILPSKFIGSKIDKIITYFILIIIFLVMIFSFSAEFPFWEEFKTRFNFIAVDYLIYTYEVVNNINESYPIPLIIGFIILVNAILFFILNKTQILKNTFTYKMKFGKRLLYSISVFILLGILMTSLSNKNAEYSENTYVNELSKNGVFSFFNAFKTNELNYHQFYPELSDKEAYLILKKELAQKGDTYINNNFDNISRNIIGNSTNNPNIMLICIESFSAEFLGKFGNKQNITPNVDLLSENSISFNNIFATGTRTVRGMEALTLCVPPTPGNSIVRRPNNDHLFSVASVLKPRNYELKFIYGGDGYFDNMNTFFGSQGFTIVDRNRGNPLPEIVETKRINIEDHEVSFENAWGICDEDIYNKTLKIADEDFKKNKPFFNFVMTTSNHRPYTFPTNKIDLPQGSREAAIKYTDYALGKFLEKAKSKPWFKNTVFVIIADHCASSAGKWEINTEKHHIPAFIYNLENKKMQVNTLASQIDVIPTLFSLFNWQYKNAFYGKDIFRMKEDEQRAVIGNYRTLGLLKNGIFTQINDRKQTKQFIYNYNNKTISKEISKPIDSLKNITISYYQTASDRFKNKNMKENKN